MARPFVFDMETSDPDDFLTLLLLLGHPEVDLKAVTVMPGTREQIGLVRWVLRSFQREIPVGAFDIDRKKDCVSSWHYEAFNRKPIEEEAPPAWEVLEQVLGPETTLVTGASLRNLGRLLQEKSEGPSLGRLFIQGGFAGDGVVPPEKQLEKFKGHSTCPSYNLNGHPKSVMRVLENRARFSDFRFVSKNVCHGVVYDTDMHVKTKGILASACKDHWVCDCDCHRPGFDALHVAPCCMQCPRCGQNIREMPTSAGPRTASLEWVHRGMDYYLHKHQRGKALHDPLAACCAIDPEIGQWAEVEIFRAKGEWGSYLAPGSGVRIIVGYDHAKFVETFLGVAR